MNNYIVGFNIDMGCVKYINKNIFDSALFKHIKKKFCQESIEKLIP